jgi:formate/nitrite transporter FocA (FNT family)
MARSSKGGQPTINPLRLAKALQRGLPSAGAGAGAHGSGPGAKDVEDNARIDTLTIYEVLRREGEQEMDRPLISLWWSGVAAGLSISFSLVAQGILQAHLPDAPWRVLVTSMGYTVGFLIAVLARHQLFTENTVTAVLPVAARPTLRNLGRMGRLWGVVLVANLVGTLVAALFCSFTPVIPQDLRAAMLDIAHEAVNHAPVEVFFKAIAAGFLIAAMVWLIPSANTVRFHVIFLMTYLIAVAGFAHIVAGSFEAVMLVANGRLDAVSMVLGFEGPALLGNIVGGTVLFSLLSYGQVAQEM